MNKMVVSLSPFEKAKQIFDYSIQLAQCLNLDVEFINHIDTRKKDWYLQYSDILPGNLSLDEIEKKIIQDRERSITRFIEAFRILEHTVSVTYSVKKGTMKGVFRKASQGKDVELAIIPCDQDFGEMPFKEAWRTIEALECPVWRLPVLSEFTPVKTIVYATDYEEEDIEALRKVAELAKKFSAAIIVVHVRRKKEYEEGLKDKGLESVIHDKVAFARIEVQSMENSHVVQGINEFCGRVYADLIVFLRKDRGIFQGLVRNRTIEKVLKTNKLPVFVYSR